MAVKGNVFSHGLMPSHFLCFLKYMTSIIVQHGKVCCFYNIFEKL